MAAETGELIALGAVLVGSLAAVAKWLTTDVATARKEFLESLKDEKRACSEDRRLDREAYERSHAQYAQTLVKITDQCGEERKEHERTIMHLLGAKKSDTGSYQKGSQ